MLLSQLKVRGCVQSGLARYLQRGGKWLESSKAALLVSRCYNGQRVVDVIDP